MLAEIQELRERIQTLELEVVPLEEMIQLHRINYPESTKDIPESELNFAPTEFDAGEVKANSPRPDLTILSPKPKQRRQRGILAAARKAIDDMDGPFDKDQLAEKLREVDEFSQREVSTRNLRNTLRSLTRAGVITVARRATPSTCAIYIKAAA